MKTNSHLPAATFLALVAFSTSMLAQSAASPSTTTTPRTNAPAARPAATTDTSATARQSGNMNHNANDNRDHKLSRADRNFFEEAAKSGMKEVEVSGAVKGRLANSQVSAFADMMVADHTAANTELKALAAKKGVTLPADKKNWAEKWNKNDGKIDEDYVETMEEDHEEAVKLFEKASKSDDTDIAAFAQKTLPKLQHHLDQVRTLKKSVK